METKVENDIFRGYVEGVGGKPILPYKTKKDISDTDNFDEDAEVLGVLSENTMAYVISDFREAENLMRVIKEQKYDVYVMRDKFCYIFIMKSVSTGVSVMQSLICGVNKVDVRVRNNSIVIRRGKNKVDVLLNPKEVCKVPDILMVTSYTLPYSTLTGTRRVDAMIGYKVFLESKGFRRDVIEKAINYCNAFLYEEPLTKEEIDELMEVSKYNTGNVDNADFAEYIADKYHTCIIGGNAYIYYNNKYTDRFSDFERVLINENRKLGSSKSLQIIKIIRLISEEREFSSPDYITFNNGTLNIKNMEFIPNTWKIISPNVIPHDYVIGKTSETLDGAMNGWTKGNKEIEQLLYEFIGYSMYRRNELRKSFFLVGEAGCGKSTFVKLLTYLLGRENLSFILLKDLSQKFKPALLEGKLLNLGDNIKGNFVNTSDMFERLVTGDTVTVERKGQDAFNMYSNAKFLFTANEMPHIKDTNGSIRSRIIIVPFENSFINNMDNFSLEIIDNLCSEDVAEALIYKGINSLKTILERMEFTVPVSLAKLTDSWSAKNGSLSAFFDGRDRDDINGAVVNDLYNEYVEFCLSLHAERETLGKMTTYLKVVYGIVPLKFKKEGGGYERRYTITN